jgi:hypothetical protein
MEIIWIEFLKDWQQYEQGDVATVSFIAKKVQRLIDKGIAKRYTRDKLTKKTEKTTEGD